MAVIWRGKMGENRAFFLYLCPKNVQHDSEFRVKKKNIAFLVLCGLCAALLTACLFDSDDSALSSWLGDQGLPDSYRVQTLTIDGLVPESATVNNGKTVFAIADRMVFGTQAGLTHDLVFDFLVDDKKLFEQTARSDSVYAYVSAVSINSFYKANEFPADSLPYKETLSLKYKWILDNGKKNSFFDSIADITHETWQNGLEEWETEESAEMDYDVVISTKDSVFRFPIPEALVEKIKVAGPICHLQLRLSAPEAKHVYRMHGVYDASGNPNNNAPALHVYAVTDTTYDKLIVAFRVSNVITYNDECDGCLLAHGGVFDSVVVEYPSDKILEALADFYGDDFPFKEGNGYDVRQAIVLAQLTFPRDDSEGYSELGLPIQVVVGSYIDSLGTEIRRMEEYKPNRKLIAESGHPNMVFYDGDSVSLQVTYGMRDLINQAKNGRNFKMMVRLGWPVLQATDSTYRNHVVKDSTTGKTDTSYVFLDHFDYARYDFGKSFSQPATLKLWLATKRGGEE